jgi:hypothetical protein
MSLCSLDIVKRKNAVKILEWKRGRKQEKRRGREQSLELYQSECRVTHNEMISRFPFPNKVASPFNHNSGCWKYTELRDQPEGEDKGNTKRGGRGVGPRRVADRYLRGTRTLHDVLYGHHMAYV